MIRDWEKYYSKEEINNAFFDVMFHQFKKDCNNPLSHEIIRNLGYRIEKYEGRFLIINDKNGKRISIITTRRKPFVAYDTGKGRTYFEWGERPKFDYINYLEVKRFVDYREYGESKSKIKYRNIYQCKSMMEYYRKEVEKCEKEIKNKLDEIKRYTKNITEYETELNSYRKEYGLKGVI